MADVRAMATVGYLTTVGGGDVLAMASAGYAAAGGAEANLWWLQKPKIIGSKGVRVPNTQQAERFGGDRWHSR